MVNLYFVRHGQTEWNAVRKLQGVKDSPLTKEGLDQSKLLKQALSQINFDRIISSPLKRAHHTAKLISHNNSKISIDENLCEMSFGEIEGTPKEEFENEYPTEFYNLWHHADLYNPCKFNGETFKSLKNRVLEFLDSLKEYENKTILVVAHGMVLKMIFGEIWEHNLTKFWEDPVPLNCSFTKVTLINGKFEIVDFSVVDHLRDTTAISYV